MDEKEKDTIRRSLTNAMGELLVAQSKFDVTNPDHRDKKDKVRACHETIEEIARRL